MRRLHGAGRRQAGALLRHRRSARSASPRSRRSRGSARSTKPHPLQQAFMDEQAAQCGYCINGMIMSAKALLDRIPHPTEAEVRAGPRRQSVPLRHPRPHHPRRTEGVASHGEDRDMNAVISRRQFAAGVGRHRRRLHARSEVCAGAADGAAAGQPRQQPHARRLDPHQRGRRRDRVAPARSSLARASSRRWRRSRPKSSTCRSRACT